MLFTAYFTCVNIRRVHNYVYQADTRTQINLFLGCTASNASIANKVVCWTLAHMLHGHKRPLNCWGVVKFISKNQFILGADAPQPPQHTKQYNKMTICVSQFTLTYYFCMMLQSGNIHTFSYKTKRF